MIIPTHTCHNIPDFNMPLCVQLLGTPSEEEWPEFARRSAKIGLGIEPTATPRKKDKPPPTSATEDKTESKKDNAEPNPTPAEDDALASFMAQIENKEGSSDEQNAMDVEPSDTPSQKDATDKDALPSDADVEPSDTSSQKDATDKDALTSDAEGKEGSSKTAKSTNTAENPPERKIGKDPAASQLSKTASISLDINMNIITTSEGPDAASVHAAQVSCAAARFVCFFPRVFLCASLVKGRTSVWRDGVTQQSECGMTNWRTECVAYCVLNVMLTFIPAHSQAQCSGSGC